MFFWNSLAFSMIWQVLSIWSLIPLPFLNQLEHLEVHGPCTVEAWLGEFWALLSASLIAVGMSGKRQWAIRTQQSHGHHHQPANSTRGRGLETKEAPMLSVATASVMDSPQRTEKTMKGNQVYGLHPHMGAYIYPKKTIDERLMHSKENYYCTTPHSQDIQPAPSPPGI